jgi:IPT/TIG domain
MPRLAGNLAYMARHREGKYLEAAMRSLPVLLLSSLIMIGCGSASKGPDPRPISVVTLSPSIMQLSPPSTPVNSVPFMLTVNGTNFGTDATVFWGGVALHTIFITPNQLMASLTSDNLQFTGLVQVYVRSAGLNSNTMDFNVTAQ